MSKSIVAFSKDNNVPAHLRTGSSLGNENVTADNLKIPRLDLIQQLSPQCIKSNPKYIEGAETGLIFDNLTNELYENVFVVNLMFEEHFSVFKKRSLGGGFEGNFETEEAARQHLESKGLELAQYDISKTGVHKCLMLDDKGVPKQPVLLYMNGSKLPVSDQWNTLIRLKGEGTDRFATAWVLSSQEAVNKQNQPYQNWKVDFAGFVNEDLYKAAKDTYLSLTGQRGQ
ncbi:hypothetical protein DV711_06365 [Motiliproteus coralliicola]|uniref:Uncharacterized protein n=1 Tax=Motiliproteus coralliicola TaxID=2283196 RepID=A0A369WU40_9GAMM|nr:hypothetical protein [Motiliproteus coralliicola]RDE25177.1 hypothetical protein DV711_06365 [Motiliproteus coralliicola]